MNTPELKSPIAVEGSADGVTFSAIPALTFAQVEFLYSAANQPIVFTTRYADLSIYTDVKITYAGRVYTVNRFVPILNTWIIFTVMTPSVPA